MAIMLGEIFMGIIEPAHLNCIYQILSPLTEQEICREMNKETMAFSKPQMEV